MRRRSFISGLGGVAAAWPSVAHAQQPKTQTIGVLSSGSAGPAETYMAALRRGLADAGYVAGQNVAIEYRWAEGNYSRLPGLAADLVGRNVDVIITPSGTPTILAAKRATSVIPVLFLDGGDPVADGLVASLAHPAGNLTGISMLLATLMPKRLELIAELVPQARVIALLVNPSNSAADKQIRDVQEAARAKSLQLPVLKASSETEIGDAFGRLGQWRAGALLVAADAFFFSRRGLLAALAAQHAVPAVYEFREFAAAGGLMTYGPDLKALFRQIGVFAGRILNGATPADLPVQQPTKFELIINLKTAKALGLAVPQSLLARADEVIE